MKSGGGAGGDEGEDGRGIGEKVERNGQKKRREEEEFDYHLSHP